MCAKPLVSGNNPVMGNIFSLLLNGRFKDFILLRNTNLSSDQFSRTGEIVLSDKLTLTDILE